MRRFCFQCLMLRIRRNHLLSLCERCAADMEFYLRKVMGYSPVNDAEQLIGGTNGNDQ